MTDLVPGQSGGGKGKGRLPEPVERVIHELLQKRFLTKQKRSLAAFHREVTQVCKAQKLRVPARNTVALRIASLDPRKVIRRREGQDAARDLQGVGGEPPAVTAPLEQVQIDHTVIDLIVVDDRDRQPIGRPYLTLAIDVFTRCVLALRARHGRHAGSAVCPDLLFTAIAPAIWGSTYIVTTQYLPNFSPMTVAMLRALPAGLLLVMIVRQIPTGIWWMRIFILGALNISLFWSLLFISVYRLPGGVAATVGAVQPLMVVFISAALLGSPIRLMAVLGAICGTAGVALLVLTPNAALDPVGVAAGLAGAVSMAFGTVLTRKWQPPVPLLTFTAWQLAAGGLLLVPVALVFDPPIPMPTGTNVLGLAWLGLIGAGLTYFLWFRGISRLEPTVVSLLGFLSPGTAVLLGWLFLDQTLSALQIIGVLLVIGSIWLGQRSNRTPRARIACRKSP